MVGSDRLYAVLRKSRKGVSSFPWISGLPSKSDPANARNRISRRFSMSDISLLLKISSLLAGTLLIKPSEE